MAKKDEKTTAATAKPEQEPTIEQHAKALGVPAWQLAGLKRLKRWGTGRQVGRQKFERELRGFLGGPMNQRRG